MQGGAWPRYLRSRLVGRVALQVGVIGTVVVPNVVILVALALPLWYWPWLFGSLMVASLVHGQVRKTYHEERGDGTKKKVAVIGAGPSGLCTAKELKAEGHEVVVYEKTGDVGGVWASIAEAHGAVTSSSAINTGFSDFPMRAEYPERAEPFFCPHDEYRRYIREYARHFGVEVQFNSTVEKVVQDNGRWLVTANGATVGFDAVAVCSGQTQVPKKMVSEIKGLDAYFPGVVKHSSEMRKDDFVGKKVLTVGAGETASDLVLALSATADRVDASVRNPVLVLNRNYWGVPPDYYETRTMYYCPRWIRWLSYKVSMCALFPLNASFARVFRGRLHAPPSALLQLRLLFTWRYFKEVFFNGRSACASIQTTKSENWLYALQKKGNHVKPGISRVAKDGRVEFEDGSSERYDAIVLCTGYAPSKFPFLGFDSDVKVRFLGVFDPSVGPSLAFVGFARGNVGSLTLAFEMQARWLALVLSGKRLLPSTMRRDILQAKSRNSAYNFSTGSWFYANYLARYHVGCEPDFFTFFLQAPLACLKAYCGPFAGYQFRLRGPHADPKAALQGYALSNSLLHIPCAWHLNHFVWLLLAPLFLLYSHIPLIGGYFQPHFDLWY